MSLKYSGRVKHTGSGRLTFAIIFINTHSFINFIPLGSIYCKVSTVSEPNIRNKQTKYNINVQACL